MRVKNKLKFLALPATLFLGMAGAQESVNACGGDATGSGGSVAFSVSQTVYTTSVDNGGSVAQGVQHAYEIFTIGIDETELNFEFSIYPNPTSHDLILEIQGNGDERLSYGLFDMGGKLLLGGDVTASKTQLVTTQLPAAAYFIRLLNAEKQPVQTFRIIKN
jgi:hypothetical protein